MIAEVNEKVQCCKKRCPLAINYSASVKCQKKVCIENYFSAYCLGFGKSKRVVLINYSYPLGTCFLLLQINPNRLMHVL